MAPRPEEAPVTTATGVGIPEEDTSLLLLFRPALIRYHQGPTLLFESQPAPCLGVRVRWMEPEGPHSVENTGPHRYHAIRVELK